MTIDYPSTQQRKTITEELDAKIIRGVANNERVFIANAVWDSKDLKDMIMCKIEKDVVNEFKGLCSRRNPSILANSTPHNVINITDASIASELKNRAPTMERILRAAMVTRTRLTRGIKS